MENLISSDICTICGVCCQKHPYIELSKIEIVALEKASGLPACDFTNQKGDGTEEYFLAFQKNGSCFFLNEDNGKYSCNVYEARSKICRNFPWKDSQHEYCDVNRKKSRDILSCK